MCENHKRLSYTRTRNTDDTPSKTLYFLKESQTNVYCRLGTEIDWCHCQKSKTCICKAGLRTMQYHKSIQNMRYILSLPEPTPCATKANKNDGSMCRRAQVLDLKQKVHKELEYTQRHARRHHHDIFLTISCQCFKFHEFTHWTAWL